MKTEIDNYGIVLLAAGASTRFGSNKLMACYKGRPMYLHTLEKIRTLDTAVKVVVSGTEEVLKDAEAMDMLIVRNSHPENGISTSLRLGLKKCLAYCWQQSIDLQGVLFCVCDQPELKEESIKAILSLAHQKPGKIICAGTGEKKGNPVCFDKVYFSELLQLTGDMGGKQVIRKHPDNLVICQLSERELQDIDTPETIKML